jgi:hypothetical protein
MREMRNACKVLFGKPAGNRQLGKTRRRWEDNIKMDLKEIGLGCGLAQDYDLRREVINQRVP